MKDMKFVIAIDSLKGCMASAEANEAAAQGVMDACPQSEIMKVTVSDGGEGWTEAFLDAEGGVVEEVDVLDPLMRPLRSMYAVCGGRAIIETAKASGLALLEHDELNPLKAKSYGTGQLIVDAIKKGCKKIVVGLGGSATSDCGTGMLEALADAFSDGDMFRLPTCDALRDVRFTIATDVANPLYGEDGAARVFAPQKGATPEMAAMLDDRDRRFAAKCREILGHDHSGCPGAGAAGGLGYAFMQFLGADRRSGADLLLEAAGFDGHLQGAGLSITGEGSADAQTLMGKLPSVVLGHATRHGVPVALLAGRVSDAHALMAAGFCHVGCINPDGIPMEVAMRKDVAAANLCRAVRDVVVSRL